MQILITGATEGWAGASPSCWPIAARTSSSTAAPRRRSRPWRGRFGAAGAYVADLASLDEVRRLATEVRSDREQLHALIGNAGLYLPERRESADGYELGFAVNYLSHFLLTLALLPTLESSPPARIVNVSSIGQQEIDFDDVMLEHRYDGFRS
jgi:NAD(P)-dependent dehydrogenase (short-subunit alcohol dehydrogenase family)